MSENFSQITQKYYSALENFKPWFTQIYTGSTTTTSNPTFVN